MYSLNFYRLSKNPLVQVEKIYISFLSLGIQIRHMFWLRNSVKFEISCVSKFYLFKDVFFLHIFVDKKGNSRISTFFQYIHRKLLSRRVWSSEHHNHLQRPVTVIPIANFNWFSKINWPTEPILVDCLK